ncbi:MAG: IS200/IS605 family transposase [Candidatus Kapabacteria bacterium]|nr:IS200/IS605 family transposase [Candidatus Kapabacteria bacterium]
MHNNIQIFIHIVFSTKHRLAILQDADRENVHAIMRAKAKERGFTVIAINSVEDHVHILLGVMSSTCILASAIRDMKAYSSKAINERVTNERSFRWQSGYYARSVNPQDVDIVKAYIDRQQEHHTKAGTRETASEYVPANTSPEAAARGSRDAGVREMPW